MIQFWLETDLNGVLIHDLWLFFINGELKTMVGKMESFEELEAKSELETQVRASSEVFITVPKLLF